MVYCLRTAELVVVQALAPFLLTAIAGSRGGIAETALPWLRIAVLAVPAILMSMAGKHKED